MAKSIRKLFQDVSKSQKNVRFNDLVRLVRAFGFEHLRTKGGHHIYRHPEVLETINLQNLKGQAKPYQVRQFLRAVHEYGLQSEEE